MRTGVFKYITNWNVPSHSQESLKDADAVAVHEFGDLETPSIATEEITRRAVAFSKKHGKPLICQYPANKTAEMLGCETITIARTHEIAPGAHIDTEEVNRQIAAVCKEKGYKSVALFAHPHHQWRVGENLKRHALEPKYPDMSGVRYDPDCSRKTVSTAWLFVPREILVRLWYRLRKLI